MFLLSPLFVFIVQCVYDLIIIIRGGFRHVRPNRGPHRNGAPTWGKRRLCMSFLTIFCWLLGALPPDPTGAPPLDTAGGTSVTQTLWFLPCKNSCGRRWGPPLFFWTGSGFE